jgi:hypothetical protein
MRFQSIILILFVLFASLATNQALGNSTRVDINDPHVIDTGNFAVTEHNKQNNETKLIFEKVVNGVVDTLNDETEYRLTLSANNGSASNNYGAIVLEKPLEHLRNLTAFALISHA